MAVCCGSRIICPDLDAEPTSQVIPDPALSFGLGHVINDKI
jgi:hypothetical protein